MPPMRLQQPSLQFDFNCGISKLGKQRVAAQVVLKQTEAVANVNIPHKLKRRQLVINFNPKSVDTWIQLITALSDVNLS